jgi:multidrug efflux pump subunit AcrA (membrane-fusion protein)
VIEKMQWKRIAILGTLLAAGLTASCATNGNAASGDSDVPLVTVRRTDLQVRVNALGELRATEFANISAPPIAGGQLQIVKLMKTGTLAKPDDVIVEFDPSSEEYNLAQNRSDYEQAEQAIVKAKDDAAVQVAQDKTALLKAQYAVRQAELDVSKKEIVSAIDAQKNELALTEAKRALAQLQQDIQSHAASNQAAIELSEEKAHKAKLAMDQAQTNIDNMRVKTTIGGMVVLLPNRNAGGIMFYGMSMPDFQEGDQTYPGSVIAQVINPEKMEIAGKVSEKSRGNIKNGQAVEIHVDGMPERTYQGTVKNVAAMVSGGFFDDDPSHMFDVTIEIDHPDNLLRPRFGARLVIQGNDLQHVLCIPRQAVFESNGKRTVYVKSGSSFEQREVKVVGEAEGVAVVEGLSEGTQVALVDPVKRASGGATAGSAGPTPALGGR